MDPLLYSHALNRPSMEANEQALRGVHLLGVIGIDNQIDEAFSIFFLEHLLLSND